MVKLYQLLEQTFKFRINSNSDIIPYIKKLNEMGKFDEPKKVAAIAIILDRLGKIEDEIDTQKSLAEITESPAVPQSEVQTTPPLEPTPPEGEPAQPEAAATDTPAQPDVPPTPEETPTQESDNTVSEFTPENITDPKPQDSTTAA